MTIPPTTKQVNMERQELIRANLKLHDENDRLTATLEELERRVPTLLDLARRLERERRVWRRTAFFWTVVALLALLVFFWFLGVRP